LNYPSIATCHSKKEVSQEPAEGNLERNQGGKNWTFKYQGFVLPITKPRKILKILAKFSYF
jgi:hypothetical protein